MFDLVIANGRILDGSGNPWVRGDVGVVGDRIAAVGSLAGAASHRRICASGQYVCPGFVDIHSHSDRSLVVHHQGLASLRQGITTQVGGNCGTSLAPRQPDAAESDLSAVLRGPLARGLDASWQTFAEYLDWLERRGSGINYIPLVGHGTVRRLVMGPEGHGGERSQPSGAELDAMRAEVGRAISAGAWGLSTGLEYPPGRNAGIDELVELCRVVAEHGGIYATHLRSEGQAPQVEWWGAVVEAIEVGRRSGVRVNVSHLKADQRAAWHKAPAVLAMLEDARRRGVEITADLYPWPYAAVGYLYEILPPYLAAGGPGALLERLASPEQRAQAREAIARGVPGWTNPALSFGWGAIGIVETGDPRALDRPVLELAAERQADPLEVVFELLLHDRGLTRSSVGVMPEENTECMLRHPLTMVSTDGYTVDAYPEAAGPEGHPPAKLHPRSVATYPRLLGRYVRERGVLTWPEAVRKSTSMPAAVLGLADRGRIAPGAYADLVVLDEASVGHTGTFAEPHLPPRGINWVLVNGKVAIADGHPTGELAGRVLRHRPDRRPRPQDLP